MLENNSPAPGGDVSAGGGTAYVPGSSGAPDRTDRMQERSIAEANPRTHERSQEAAPDPHKGKGRSIRENLKAASAEQRESLPPRGAGGEA